jgi:carbon monoxide dehydrogenase subunit G
VSDAKYQFGGTEEFTIDAARLFEIVTNLDNVATTIPDAESTERVDATTLKAVVRPGFSFLRGKLTLMIRVVESRPPHEARTVIDGQGIGMRVVVESHVRIAPTAAGSQLTWEARVTEMKGLIATLSPSLVQGAAEQVIRSAWQKIHAASGK